MRGSWLYGGRYLNAKTVSPDTQRHGWVRDEPGYIRMLCLSRSLAMLSKRFPRDPRELSDSYRRSILQLQLLGSNWAGGVARILCRERHTNWWSDEIVARQLRRSVSRQRAGRDINMII